TKTPRLTVNKVCNPATDGGAFNLLVDGNTVKANAACGSTTGAQEYALGTRTVSESQGTNTSLANYTSVFSGDCDATGHVTLAAGDNKVCTITNTHKATLTVNKVCVPSTDTGKFNLRVDGTTVTSDAACGTGTGAQVYSAGSHLVSETAGAGTSLGDYLAAGFGGACDAQGNGTLAA